MEMIDITCPNCGCEIHVYSSAQLDTNLTEVGTRAVRGYSIDADYLMAKVAEEYGERARDALYRIIRYMPPAQPEEQCDNCHYKHIWMTQRMNGNGYFGHGGATG